MNLVSRDKSRGVALRGGGASVTLRRMTLVSALISTAWLIAGAAIIALVLYVAALISTAWHARRGKGRTLPESFPPITLLKPLKGLEDELEANLRSFFELDYPGVIQIVFATTELDDPARTVAEAVAAEYPNVDVAFAASDERFGLNPKVANLSGAIALAKYDLVHQSDANVRVSSDYLRDIVAEYIEKDASMLSSVVVGVGETSAGAALENLQLSGFIGPAMCLADVVANITCVCGKSMLFSRSELENEFGGLGSVRNVLCEDFVLGERYKKAGKKVVLSATRVRNVNVDCGADRFYARHSRWLKMRATLHVPGFFADLFSNPTALMALALPLSGFDADIALVGAMIVGSKTVLDQVGVWLSRGEMLAPRFWLLSPVKDLALLPLWFHATFSRTVVWRGRTLRFGKETRLIPIDDARSEALASVEAAHKAAR